MSDNPMMRFTISGTRYDMADVRMVSLKDLLLLRNQGEDLGLTLDAEELERMQDELLKIEDTDARGQHPDALVFLAVSIWLSRRKAGEDITLVDAIDFPLVELNFLPDPQDKKPAKKTAAKKAAGPTRPRSRPASARAAKPRAAGAAK